MIGQSFKLRREGTNPNCPLLPLWFIGVLLTPDTIHTQTAAAGNH